jgi:2-oxo-3-(phosphooxy)propyl 3-oxoalkanoate synthase
MTAELETVTDVFGDGALSIDLSFAQTIERTRVHRASIAEVFVTDLQPLGPARFLAGAQLPLTHGYYSDHAHRPALFDPLLVLEAGRQAGIAGAHLMGLPREIAMLVKTFSLEIDRPAALAVGTRPGELRIDNSFEATRVTAGRVRAGLVRQQLYLRGLPLGRHVMEIQVLNYREHELLRGAMRATPAPSTSDFADAPDPQQTVPNAVGRVHPLNVAVAGVVRGPGTVTARVTPRFGNRALFDHDYDHLPAMTLTEAARQLALVSVDNGSGFGLARIQVVGVSGTFWRFAELDQPVVATATTAPANAGAGRITTHVHFVQNSMPVAESTVTLVPSSPIGASHD